jgi:TrmH family RNA methyltransferase
VVEGAGLAEVAIRAGLDVEVIYRPVGAVPLEGPLAAVPLIELAPGVLERVASTQSPQPLLAVVGYRPARVEVLRDARFVVAAAAVADPGNLGTILRTAEAAGADAVVLTPDTVDVTNPKVVRASAGALFLLPVVAPVELADLRGYGLRTVGTSSRRGRPYDDVDLTGPVAIVVGNEAHGLPDHAPVDEWVTVPQVGRAESLNVAMATAVVCFEVARQRRPPT